MPEKVVTPLPLTVIDDASLNLPDLVNRPLLIIVSPPVPEVIAEFS